MAETIGLATECLLACTGGELRLEEEKLVESEIASLAALDVLLVEDTTPAKSRLETGENVLAHVKHLATLTHTTASDEEQLVQTEGTEEEREIGEIEAE